jgi:hypothetical protein
MKNEQAIRNIGMSQRMLIWAVLASDAGVIISTVAMMANLGIIAAIPQALSFTDTFLFQFYYAFTLLFHIYCVYTLSQKLELGAAASAAFSVAMYLPIVNLVCLYVLNSKATGALRNAGLRVGPLGVEPADLPAAGEGVATNA